ncbi:histone-lysine N-methyltransferase, H3 lysine-9 specific SUVH4-like [Canna indica]|uniref:Histone-lysine N-methyltransferase, H3 lysine-9 specific SUVH4-like n=1 Tax=Canna indica TaxID=4628 RepID=A0AAQ3KEJ1_9LILI|nr:histone-lysine N-methyltransferase, H3 lysine-9 specific SUVH4-like [Canna indica]
MAETDELPRLPCVSNFPAGCGPHALVIDRKPKEDPPPPAAESKEFAAEKSPAASIPVGCSEPPVVDSPAFDLGNNAAADGQTSQGMIEGSSESNQGDKLGSLDDGLEQPKASDALGTAGSRKRPCTSNSCSPPRRRAALAIRDFPVGCGPNTPRMTREEALKLVAKEKSPIEETATSKDSTSPKVVTSNEEIVQEREAEVHVSNSLPTPNSEALEAENKQFVVKETTSDENTIPAFGTPDKRLDEQAIEPLSNILEAQTSTTTGRYEQDAENSKACGERLIIQALMAAPNCPWRQGRKSFSRGSRSVTTAKSKMKREATTSAAQLALPKSKRERTTPEQPALAKPKLEETTSDMQLGSEESYDENEGTLTLYQGSSEQCATVSPLSVDEGSAKLCVNVPPIGPSGWDCIDSSRQDVAARHEVRRVLRLFQVLCRKLMQGEEAKSKEPGNIKRVDQSAAQILKENNEWVNTNKQFIGIVPGVEVGDEFQYRVELSIVGLHRPFQGGIDAVKKDGTSVATSIVASGGYKDDMDSSDVLIYSGSGGNPAGPNKQREDQKLERGNLALKNSIDAKTPVRVIHGIKEMKGGSSSDTRPKLVSTYTYAGLYLVEKYWQEKEPRGFNVFKFQLRRIPGQPELALHEVKRSKKSKEREGLCIYDISNGIEKMPICVINTINDDRPPSFTYITKLKYPSWYAETPPKGCDCMNGCSDSEKCACAAKNGGEIPFNFNGSIVQAKPLVYECGPSCKCPPTCHNRVSQHGVQIQLEIFRTNRMGWGVRSLHSIPSGSFICEYAGELLDEKEAEKRSNDEYLFDVGYNYDDHSLWEGLPSLIPDLNKPGSQCDTVDYGGFTIDAAEYGNVGRFVNHSCSPNLYAQNVLYDHDDRRIPHIMLFAAENIPPLQELTYHYNYKVDEVYDAEGNKKRKDCYCGSPECTGRLY